MISEVFLKKIELELFKRKSANPQYSLRAFARDLDISVSILSRVRAHVLPLSENLKLKLKVKLFNSENEFNAFAIECLNTPDFFPKTSHFKTSDLICFRLWYFWTLWQARKKSDPKYFLESITRELEISQLDVKTLIHWFSQIQSNNKSGDTTCFSFANVFKHISQNALEERYLLLLQNLPQNHFTEVAPFISQKASPIAINKELAKRIHEKIINLTHDIVSMIEEDTSPKDQVCELIVSLLPSQQLKSASCLKNDTVV